MAIDHQYAHAHGDGTTGYYRNCGAACKKAAAATAAYERLAALESLARDVAALAPIDDVRGCFCFDRGIKKLIHA